MAAYNTKQRAAILDTLSRYSGDGVTIKQLLQMLDEDGVKIGQSTLYRRIKGFEDEKLVRSYQLDGEVYYEIIPQGGCVEHLHLVCEKCHKTIHMDCEFMDEFTDHVRKEHGFLIDKPRSVIYGICKECAKNEA